MLTTKHNNLNLTSETKFDVFSNSYIFGDDLPEKKKYGNLYVVIEIALNEELASKISEIVSEVLKKEYYKDSSTSASESVIVNFEKALNKTNQALSTLASEGYVDWINRSHVAIAAVHNNKIHFASTGQAKIYLYRNKNLIAINQKGEESSSSPMKTFVNITSGSLLNNDKLFFVTPSFQNIISEEELKNTVNENPKSPLESIKAFVSNLDNYSTISTIFVDMKDENEFTQSSEESEFKFPSLNKIENSEDEEPEGAETVENEPETESNIYTPPTSPEKSMKDTMTIKNDSYFKKSGQALKNLASSIKTKNQQRKLRPGARTQNKYDGPAPKNMKERVLLFFKKLGKNLLDRFNAMPRSSKIFFVASVILAILFLGSLIVIKVNRGQITKLGQHELILEDAINKQGEAENALIYNDREKAKTLLAEAKEDVQGLLDKEVLVEESEVLMEKIDDNLDKAEGITRIKDPIALADTDNKNFNTLIGLQDIVYLFDKNNNFIYELDEENKSLSNVKEESNNVGYFQLGAINDQKKTIIFQTDSPGFVEYSLLNKTVENLEVDIFNKDEETKDIALFGDRLYTLIPEARQIYKHTRTITGFSKGVEWVLSENDDIANGVSITIDGFIYMLKQNGEVVKYLRGSQQDFSINQPQNPIENATKIYTNENIDNLYILEPEKNRVIAYNKNSGKLMAQFYSDSFNDMRDIYVNDEEQKLYILCKDKVYGVVINIQESN